MPILTGLAGSNLNARGSPKRSPNGAPAPQVSGSHLAARVGGGTLARWIVAFEMALAISRHASGLASEGPAIGSSEGEAAALGTIRSYCEYVATPSETWTSRKSSRHQFSANRQHRCRVCLIGRLGSFGRLGTSNKGLSHGLSRHCNRLLTAVGHASIR